MDTNNFIKELNNSLKGSKYDSVKVYFNEIDGRIDIDELTHQAYVQYDKDKNRFFLTYCALYYEEDIIELISDTAFLGDLVIKLNKTCLKYDDELNAKY
jgi:hypothetical protein